MKKSKPLPNQIITYCSRNQKLQSLKKSIGVVCCVSVLSGGWFRELTAGTTESSSTSGARGLVAEFEAEQRGFQTNANGERRANANEDANVNGKQTATEAWLSRQRRRTPSSRKQPRSVTANRG
ncbi:uncharacterized protein DS421_13g426410 [Arachis hypogaea]|nr:uncharacterized protein DS421_13g426410 [Arachis hypogaea]